MNPYEPPQILLDSEPVEPRPTVTAPKRMSGWAIAVGSVSLLIAAIPALFLAMRFLHALGIDMGPETNVLDDLIPYAILIVGTAAGIIWLLIMTRRRKS